MPMSKAWKRPCDSPVSTMNRASIFLAKFTSYKAASPHHAWRRQRDERGRVGTENLRSANSQRTSTTGGSRRLNVVNRRPFAPPQQQRPASQSKAAILSLGMSMRDVTQFDKRNGCFQWKRALPRAYPPPFNAALPASRSASRTRPDRPPHRAPCD